MVVAVFDADDVQSWAQISIEAGLNMVVNFSRQHEFLVEITTFNFQEWLSIQQRLQ